mgnify:FL=1|tara:strand:- start:1379 stop:1792 length:414 start_codon:yes stop_codon:yes gene_type:complete
MSGIEERNIGMARAELGARPSQKRAAKMAIKKCVIKHGPWQAWTTDEVHVELEKMGVELDNARLLGPLMKRAQRTGMIEPVVCGSCNRQETRLSKRKKRHAGPQYMWRSNAEYYHQYWEHDEEQMLYVPDLELGGEG